MEHLTRNTNNDRIIYTIENLKKENSKNITKEIKELSDRVVTAVTGILSSLISAILVSLLKDESAFKDNFLVFLIIFMVILFIIWFVFGRYVLPLLQEKLFKNRIDLSVPHKSISVKHFNTDIMQKIAEIDEIVDVIKSTEIVDCKRMNFILSLYKLQEIVNFIHGCIMVDKVKIRKSKEDSSVETFRYSFNLYTLSAVIAILNHIAKEMLVIIKDSSISSLDGYDLLKSDLDGIIEKLNKICIKK